MGLNKKAAHLMALAESAGVLKKEAQEITHKKLDAAQPAIGDQMQKEVESGSEGNYASDKSVDAELKGTVEVENKIEGDDDKKAEKDLAETGTSVDKIHPCGAPAGTPAEVVKSAAFKTRIEAVVKAEMAKEAALKQAQEEAAKQEELKKEAAAKEASEEVTTATEVLNKIASLNEVKTQDEFIKLASDIDVSFEKLQKTNPLFNIAVEHKLMEKQAAEIDALSAANGISPEEAATALDAATDEEAANELRSEAEGEALSDLAGAEQEQAAFMDGLDQTAAEVSQMLGQEVTGDDIAQAVSDVVEAAEQMGVEPEVLLEAAAQEMLGGEGGEEPSEADMAQAQQILDEAAKQGISPEEVIQAVAQEMEGGEEAPAEAAPEAAPEAPVEEPAKEEAPAEEVKKEASLAQQEVLKKLASTRRGANLLKVLEKR